MTKEEFNKLYILNTDLNTYNKIINDLNNSNNFIHIELEFWDTVYEKTSYKRLDIPKPLKQEIAEYIKRRIIEERNKLAEEFEKININY